MFGFAVKLKYRFNKLRFQNACKRIRLTRPIEYTHKDDVRILSQVHHDAVDMYLLAIKTFLYHFTIGSVYVLNDGSLTGSDIELIKYHVPGVTIQHIENIDASGFPVGNTWERLLYYIDLSKDAYVIQLDSDTLSLMPMLDLHEAIRESRSFIIGNGPAWERPISVDYLLRLIGNWSANPKQDHVQVASESVFPLLQFFQNSRAYYRGCSAFTGLARGQISREMLKDFCRQVEAEIGRKKWLEWGSEQVACRVMISATKSPMILPWLSYQNYGFPSLHRQSLVTASLIHFIGTYRFADGAYQKLAVRAIQDLNVDKLG